MKSKKINQGIKPKPNLGMLVIERDCDNCADNCFCNGYTKKNCKLWSPTLSLYKYLKNVELEPDKGELD